MASVYPAKITLHSIPEIVQKHNLLVDMLGKDLSAVVRGGGVGDVKSPVFPGAIDNTVVLFDGTSGKRIKASTIYADWFDQSVATTADVAFSSVSTQSIILTQDTTDDERHYPYLLGAWHPDSGYAFAARATDANHYIEDALNMSGGVPTTLRDIDLETGETHIPLLAIDAVVAETVNGITLTSLETGFSISGGDTSKTLTIPDNATVSGTNTGDQDLSPYTLKTNVLELDNAVAFTPDADYEPSTKKYVDDLISGKQDILIADTDYLTPATAATTYEPLGGGGTAGWTAIGVNHAVLSGLPIVVQSYSDYHPVIATYDDTAMRTLEFRTGNYSKSNILFGLMNHDPAPTGGNNLGIGNYALTEMTVAENNTAYGHVALSSLTSGEDNVAVGIGALANITTQSQNTAIGALAGANATGARGVYIGATAGLQETADDKLHIGNGLYDDLISGDFSDGSIAIKTSLTVGGVPVVTGTPLAGTKVYYVADTSGGSPTRKLTFTDGVLTSET